MNQADPCAAGTGEGARKTGFSIITPSFRQLEWLRLCVASVRDQIEERAGGGLRRAESKISLQASGWPLTVEHIIQDAGTPGIEDFAREIGADFYRDGTLVFGSEETGDERQETSAKGPTTPKPRPYRLSVHCERDAGMYDAINRGLDKSSGTICAWLNSDEQYLPGALQQVWSHFCRDPQSEALIGDTVLLDELLQPRSYRRGVPPMRDYIQQFQLNMHSSSFFFRRSVLDRGIRLDPRFRSVGDAEWIARLIDDGLRIDRLPVPLSTFLLGDNNLSKNPLSDREKTEWRGGQPMGYPARALLKACYQARRLAAGAFLPRKCAVDLFTPEDLTSRKHYPSRWLDFRFRV